MTDVAPPATGSGGTTTITVAAVFAVLRLSDGDVDQARIEAWCRRRRQHRRQGRTPTARSPSTSCSTRPPPPAWAQTAARVEVLALYRAQGGGIDPSVALSGFPAARDALVGGPDRRRAPAGHTRPGGGSLMTSRLADARSVAHRRARTGAAGPCPAVPAGHDQRAGPGGVGRHPVRGAHHDRGTHPGARSPPTRSRSSTTAPTGPRSPGSTTSCPRPSTPSPASAAPTWPAGDASPSTPARNRRVVVVEVDVTDHRHHPVPT